MLLQHSFHLPTQVQPEEMPFYIPIKGPDFQTFQSSFVEVELVCRPARADGIKLSKYQNLLTKIKPVFLNHGASGDTVGTASTYVTLSSIFALFTSIFSFFLWKS